MPEYHAVVERVSRFLTALAEELERPGDGHHFELRSAAFYSLPGRPRRRVPVLE